MIHGHEFGLLNLRSNFYPEDSTYDPTCYRDFRERAPRGVGGR